MELRGVYLTTNFLRLSAPQLASQQPGALENSAAIVK